MTRVAHRAPALARLLAAVAAMAIAGSLLVASTLASSSLADLTLPPTREGVYVYDLAGIWSQATIDRAQQVAEQVRARTQAQIAVVSWPSEDFDVSTETAKTDARTIMDTWGVGRVDINDGLVVLYDMNNGSRDHGEIFVYGGTGFRAEYLDQEESDDLVFGTMLPLAKEGKIDASLVAGMEEIDKAVQVGGNPGRAGRATFNAILAAIVLGAGVLAFVLFLRTWWERGRDAEVPLIDDSVLLPTPPPGLTPALATVLRNDGVDRDAFTSALVDLGHRGLVTFQEADDDKEHVDLVIPPSPLIDPNSLEARRRPIGDAEEALARSVAGKSIGGVLSWSTLKAGEGAKLYESFKKNLGRASKAAGYFREDPNKLTTRWVGFAILLIVAVVVFGFVFAFDLSEDSPNLFKPGRTFLLIPMVVSVVLGVVIAVFSGRLAARTNDGARALGMALAYRNTLKYEMKEAHTVDEAVEKTKSRLPWITTPDLLTVWAVAFGLKDEIDDLIKATFAEAARTGSAVWVPTWYAGSGGIASVGNLASSIGSISTSATSSSGSGYGGGGGGGGGGSGGGF